MLTYCGTILHQQHPDIPAKIRLEQEGLIVRILVETPAAHRDTIEQTLRAYGLVVAGQKTPDDFLVDPWHAQQLHRKLVGIETALRRPVHPSPCLLQRGCASSVSWLGMRCLIYSQEVGRVKVHPLSSP